MTSRRTPAVARAERYAADNLECAECILRAPERWGGEQAALVQWARAVVAKHEASEQAWRLTA